MEKKKGLEVIILSGDRDTFQLATDNVKNTHPKNKKQERQRQKYMIEIK